jgi:hypothetical protein
LFIFLSALLPVTDLRSPSVGGKTSSGLVVGSLVASSLFMIGLFCLMKEKLLVLL